MKVTLIPRTPEWRFYKILSQMHCYYFITFIEPVTLVKVSISLKTAELSFRQTDLWLPLGITYTCTSTAQLIRKWCRWRKCQGLITALANYFFPLFSFSPYTIASLFASSGLELSLHTSTNMLFFSVEEIITTSLNKFPPSPLLQGVLLFLLLKCSLRTTLINLVKHPGQFLLKRH